MYYNESMRTLYTIGHSTRPIEEFISLLRQHDITRLVDIRTIPKSRHNPQYQQDALAAYLTKAGIEYVYLKELGGLRHHTDSMVNDGWHNASFRNYADYMQTDEFTAGLQRLMELSKDKTTAIMCAEAVPWRCHRSLVSDALVVRNVPVREIISDTSARDHALTRFAVVHGTTVTYPKSPESERMND